MEPVVCNDDIRHRTSKVNAIVASRANKFDALDGDVHQAWVYIDTICSDTVSNSGDALCAANAFSGDGHVAGMNIKAGGAVLNDSAILQKISQVRHVNIDPARNVWNIAGEFDHALRVGGKLSTTRIRAPLDNVNITTNRGLRAKSATKPVLVSTQLMRCIFVYQCIRRVDKGVQMHLNLARVRRMSCVNSVNAQCRGSIIGCGNAINSVASNDNTEGRCRRS